MTDKTIHIIPSIYMIEITTASNNHSIKCFCMPCLAKSKVNKVYKEYSNYPSLSNVRVCCICGDMTIEAAIAAFNIPKHSIVTLAESKGQLILADETLSPHFHIESLYLNILKKDLKNGEKERRNSNGRY